MYIAVVQTDKRSTSIRVREDARFRRGVQAVTGGCKARHIGSILRTVWYGSVCPPSCAWCVLHVIIFGIVGENAGRPRLNGSLPRCSPCTIAYCAKRAQIWLRRGASSTVNFGGRHWTISRDWFSIDVEKFPDALARHPIVYVSRVSRIYLRTFTSINYN